ncbi:uncharacterized protein PAC_02089 [Phialocephala subalpina]|uniref:Uncharacterized protein n=1 Tax=Phialocephala subalpina TaxID=576137 RepID=A0A1L7WHG1_9HELO|nr:uncharacterized protein PAC_02089 [Phialocephala subalpina]
METMAIDRYITTTYSDATTIAPSDTVSPEASTDDTNSTAMTTTARPKALETLVSITTTETVSWGYIDLTTTDGPLYTTTKTPHYRSVVTTYPPSITPAINTLVKMQASSTPLNTLVKLQSSSTMAVLSSTFRAAAPTLGVGMGGILAAGGVAAFL